MAPTSPIHRGGAGYGVGVAGLGVGRQDDLRPTLYRNLTWALSEEQGTYFSYNVVYREDEMEGLVLNCESE